MASFYIPKLGMGRKPLSQGDSGRVKSWKVTHTAAGQSLVEVDGEPVSDGVRQANITVGPHGDPPQLTLETVPVVDVEVFGESDPLWVGLERVPDVALIGELRSRGWRVDAVFSGV